MTLCPQSGEPYDGILHDRDTCPLCGRANVPIDHAMQPVTDDGTQLVEWRWGNHAVLDDSRRDECVARARQLLDGAQRSRHANDLLRADVLATEALAWATLANAYRKDD